MSSKITVGPINKALRNDRTAFVIDNDSFPTLINAYQWRGRVKRKRGTSFLNRLQRFFNSSSTSYNSGSTTITLDGGGNGNLLMGFSLQTNGTIVPGNVTLVGSTGPVTYTDPTQDGYLTPTGTGGPNTINYATGAIVIPAQAGATVTASFNYNPSLPVMGLEDLTLIPTNFPGTIEFDTKYSYNVLTAFPYPDYDVSFYKNPATQTINGIAYTQKTNPTPTSWNSQDYQQFWTVNYQGALWATNGIPIPFSVTNIGMQFQIPATVARTDAQTMTFTINNCPLVVGDWVFVNELVATTPSNANFINFQTGFVTSVVTVGIVSTVIVKFPFATIPADAYTGGMIQYLTNRSDITKDCLRFYDGDPTNGNVNTPSLTGNNGWVNFAPPPYLNLRFQSQINLQSNII